MTEAEGEGRPWCWAEWMGTLLHPEAAGDDGRVPEVPSLS